MIDVKRAYLLTEEDLEKLGKAGRSESLKDFLIREFSEEVEQAILRRREITVSGNFHTGDVVVMMFTPERVMVHLLGDFLRDAVDPWEVVKQELQETYEQYSGNANE